jgi:hypothetical protein
LSNRAEQIPLKKGVASMRRISLLVSTLIVMVALVLTVALPALAASPTLYVECRTGGFVDAYITVKR